MPAQVGDVVAVDGALEALVRLVAAAPDHLSTEAAWVLAYITGARAPAAMPCCPLACDGFAGCWACSRLSQAFRNTVP